MLGTHQGAIGQQHLDDYLNEFVFRFNRRKSASRGKLFFRLTQQAVQIAPTTYERLVRPACALPERHCGEIDRLGGGTDGH